MARIAAFVDAGYFWVQICRSITGRPDSKRSDVVLDHAVLHRKMLDQIALSFPKQELLRVYWYDGPDMSGSKSAHHDEIDRLNDFKLRLGTRNGVGQQKGVDGLIIADLISLTQQKSIDSALLISGDADIAPGVIAAQSMGARVHLLTIASNSATSPALMSEMDNKHLWSVDDLRTFVSLVPAANQVHALPSLPIPIAEVAKHAYDYFISVGKVVGTLTAGDIPRDLDAELLRCARDILKRPRLDQTELKELRQEFAKLTQK